MKAEGIRRWGLAGERMCAPFQGGILHALRKGGGLGGRVEEVQGGGGPSHDATEMMF